MKNKKTTISANEINKYSYCPYQWYYERYYGTKKLRELYKERNELLGIGYENSALSNLSKGRDYHSSFLKPAPFVRRALAFVLLLIVILVLFVLITYFLEFEFAKEFVSDLMLKIFEVCNGK